MTLTIRFMCSQDIPQVKEIDHDAFPTEWPPTNFPRELENKMAHYIVVYDDEKTNQASNPKPVVKEKEKGFFDRARRFFLPKETLKNDPVEEVTIIGYAGMWIMADEAHVTSIASGEDHRHQGIGEALLIALIELAMVKKVRIVTLEARVSNQIAQNLYYKFGFDKLGMRKAYYLDNKEDAVIMSTEYIGSPSFKEKFTRAKQNYNQKWGTIISELPGK